MKQHGRVITVLVLLLIVIIALPSAVYALAADSKEVTLTYEDACNLALKQTHSIVEIDQAIKHLSDQYDDAIELRNKMEEILNGLDEYEKLLDKQKNGTQLSELEKWQLGMYMGMFGPKPYEISQVDIYKNYVVNRDITFESVWNALESTKLSKESTILSIKQGIRQVYDGILDLQDAIALQQQLYDNMLKQNDQMLKKYKLGAVSEIDKYQSEIGLTQQKLNIDKLKRSLDNLEMSLKQQLGLPLTERIVLTPYKESKPNITITYQEYLDKALNSRSEVINAKRDLDLKKKEQDIMKQYILNDLLTERLEAQQAVDEKQVAYDEAIVNVKKDIYNGYKDISKLKADIDIATQKQVNAENQYKNALAMYQKGLTSLSSLWDADMNRSQTKAAYIKALRDYKRALDKLDAACGFGPAYVTSMGGF